jgi:hypothetical protein
MVYTVTGEDRVNAMRAMWSTQSQVRIGLTLRGAMWTTQSQVRIGLTLRE